MNLNVGGKKTENNCRQTATQFGVLGIEAE